MQVRKFEAPTIQEALKIIKQELGPDAIILSTKNHRKGFGLLSKASVEVTAAVSEKNLFKKQITEKAIPVDQKDVIRQLTASKQAEVYNEFSEYYTQKSQNMRDDKKKKENLDAIRTKLNARSERYADISDEGHEKDVVSTTRGAHENIYNRSGKVTSVSSDVQEARQDQPVVSKQELRVDVATQNSLHNLQSDVERLKQILEEVKSEQTANTDSKIVENGSAELNQEFQNLLRNGIDKKYVSQLLKQAAFSLSFEQQKNSNKIIEALAVEMMNNIRVEQILDYAPGTHQKIYTIVGPTGVGKTTTIAKIAAQAILQKSMKVGLINLDTYKVSAVDQLSTYAKILNTPFRQVSNIQELDRALSEFKPLDLILIDTTGHSQKDSENLSNMKKLLQDFPSIQSLLLMSATTRDQELYDILARFRIFNPKGLVFSKLDEASVYGCIYNIALKTNLPLAYFTVGQRVPEDIEVATKERVVDLVLDL